MQERALGNGLYLRPVPELGAPHCGSHGVKMESMKTSIFVSVLSLGCHLADSGDIVLDQDNDGFIAQEDCNDQDAAIHPNATELCDEIDNDCDGLIDSEDDSLEGGTTIYVDADDDGYGAPGTGSLSCSTEAALVTNDDDCDDVDAFIHPGALEICDGIDSDCDGAPDAHLVSTGNRNYDTITEALQDAPDGAQINICDGTWTENLEINQSVQLTSMGGPEQTILDGGDLGSVIHITGGDVVIDGLTITNGSAEGGGGVHLESGNLTLQSSIIRDNDANWAGGVLVGTEAEFMTIQSTTIQDNEASQICGGLLAYYAPLSISNSVISDNSAPSCGALGIYSLAMTIEDSLIENNTAASYGGGLLISSANATLTNTTVIGNESQDTGGGAFIEDSDVVCTDGTTFTENVATVAGGGVLLEDSDIQDCSLANNTADMGGGIAVVTESSGATQTIQACEIRDNTAISWGGGVYADASQLNVNNAIIDANTASYGGGVYVNNDSTVVMDRSRVSSNEALTLGGGIRLVSESVTGSVIDLGAGGDDNSPDDIAVSGVDSVYSGYGKGTNFFCYGTTTWGYNFGCSF